MPYALLEDRRKCKREWARKNRPQQREQLLSATRRWRKNHPDEIRAYKRTRKQTDPGHRLLEYARTRIWCVLKRNYKSAHTVELLGCSVAEWKQHLESLFVPGMTWENYGPVWHVDHITPCSKFDHSDPSQQKLCFNWSNTQPLFAGDNLSKGDR